MQIFIDSFKIALQKLASLSNCSSPETILLVNIYFYCLYYIL